MDKQLTNDAFAKPTWWTQDKHESAWDRTKDALQRDWEQTKNDVGGGGADLRQGVTDTVKQASGKEAIPPTNVANPREWSEVAEPMRFGVGAREQYGAEHPKWTDKLEATLKNDWEGAGGKIARAWDDVKASVRHAYERMTH